MTHSRTQNTPAPKAGVFFALFLKVILQGLALGVGLAEAGGQALFPAEEQGQGAVPGHDLQLGQGVLHGQGAAPEAGVAVGVGEGVRQHFPQ